MESDRPGYASANTTTEYQNQTDQIDELKEVNKLKLECFGNSLLKSAKKLMADYQKEIVDPKVKTELNSVHNIKKISDNLWIGQEGLPTRKDELAVTLYSVNRSRGSEKIVTSLLNNVFSKINDCMRILSALPDKNKKSENYEQICSQSESSIVSLQAEIHSLCNMIIEALKIKSNSNLFSKTAEFLTECSKHSCIKNATGMKRFILNRKQDFSTNG